MEEYDNYLACIAVLGGDFKRAIDHFEQAKELGSDDIIDGNLQSLRAWVVAGGLQSGHQINLIANHDCERSFIAKQPLLPGPIITQDILAASDTSPIVFMPQQ